MTQQIDFLYPVYFESEYKFPTNYYLNVTTGHNIIKREQINIIDTVTIGPDGIILSTLDTMDKNSDVPK